MGEVGHFGSPDKDKFGASRSEGCVNSRQDVVIGEGVRDQGRELHDKFTAGHVVTRDNEGDRLLLLVFSLVTLDQSWAWWAGGELVAATCAKETLVAFGAGGGRSGGEVVGLWACWWGRTGGILAEGKSDSRTGSQE